MSLWLIIIGVLILQEFASSAIVLVVALQNNYTLWFINLIWLAATLFDMYIGFTFGKWLRSHYGESRLVKKIEGWVDTVKRMLGNHGEKFSLAFLGTINFPYLNAFFGAWLGMPMGMVFVLTLAGNFLWYLVLLATVLGVSSLTSNPDIIILIIVALGVLSHFLLKYFRHSKN